MSGAEEAREPEVTGSDARSFAAASEERPPVSPQVVAAWGVHAFTASGVIAGLLAIAALIAGDFRMVLLWLGAALLIDGFDGPMARKAKVTHYAPQFDGAILDHVIDYLTYSVIPALMVYRFGLVPVGWAIPAAANIMTTSLYCFGNRDMKTKDNYFSGFPATWNIVVLFFFIFWSPAWLNLLVIIALGILTFVPIKFIHPFRVKEYRPLTIAMTGIWGGLTFALVVTSEPGVPPGTNASAVYWAWVVICLYFTWICVRRSIRDFRDR